MKHLVIYNSSTGFSERYALYIASALKADAFSWKTRKKADLSAYDVLVYGGGIMAEEIAGIRYYQAIKDEFRASFLFACGASPLGYKDLPLWLEKQRARGLDVTYLPGGLDYGRMKAPLRFLMKHIWAPSMRKSEGEDFYNIVRDSYDISDMSLADSLIERIQGFSLEQW